MEDSQKIHEYPLVSVFFGWFGTKLKHILHHYNHGKWLGLKGNDPIGDTPILHEKTHDLWEDPGGSLQSGGSLPWDPPHHPWDSPPRHLHALCYLMQ